MTTISQPAIAQARQHQVPLEKLSAQQLENLDTDGSGAVDLHEEQAYERMAGGVRSDGFVDRERAAGVNAVLGQAFPGQGLAADYHKEGAPTRWNYLHSDNAERGIHSEVDQTRAQLQAAEARLAATPKPPAGSRPLAQLQAEHQSLKQQEAALRESLTTGRATVTRQEAELQALLPRQAAAHEYLAKHPSNGGEGGLIALRQKEIARREAMLEALPTLEARDTRLAAVQRELTVVEEAFHRRPSAELGRRLTELKSQVNSLKSFEPEGTAREVSALRRGLDTQTAAESQREGVAKQAAGLDGQVAALRQSIAQGKAQLQGGTQALTQLQQRAAALQPRLSAAQAHAQAQGQVTQLRGRLESLQAQQAAVGKLADLRRGGEAALDGDRELLAQARALASEGEVHLGALKNSSGHVAKHLGAAATLLQQAEQDPKVARSLDMYKLRKYVGETTEVLQQQAARVEEDSARAAKLLADPAFQEAVKRMPEAERQQLLPRLTALLSRSEPGKAYLRDTLLPALQRPGEEGFWGTMLKGPKSVKTALGVLDGAAGFIVTSPQAPQVLEDILKNTFKVSKDQLSTIALAYELEKNGAQMGVPARLLAGGYRSPADTLLQDNKLGGLIGNLKLFTHVAGSIAGGIEVARNLEAFKQGDVKGMATAVKGGAEAVEGAGKVVDMLTKTNTPFGAFAGAVGKLVPVAEVVIGYKHKEQAEQLGDIGGAIAGSFMETGGIVGTVGTVFPPLRLVGKVINWTGQGIDVLFGYNDTQKWLVRNNLSEFMK